MSKQQSWTRWLLLLPPICALGLAASLAAGPDLRLVEAVKNKDHDAIRSLLKQHVDVNTTQPDGATALHWAAHWDDLETANALIQAGAKVNAANEYGYTPLTLACDNGSGSMVEALVKAGADANSALPTGETILMSCAHTGNVQAVKTLLDAGAKVNVKEPRRGQTALMRAISEKHPEVTQLLVQHGADVHARSSDDFTPLMFAAKVGDIESAKILLAAGEDVNESLPTEDPLHKCRLELERCVYISKLAKPASPLYIDPESADTPPPVAAVGAKPAAPKPSAASGPAETADAESGGAAPAGARGQRGARGGASGQPAKPVEDGPMLARDGRGTPDWEELDGMTPLLIAAASGQEPMGIFLLDRGANPNAVDIAGGTALHWCVLKGITSINGSYHLAPLSYIYRPNMLNLMKALLAHGGNPNVRLTKSPTIGGRNGGNVIGGTPFLFAAASADAAAMRILADGGADPNMKNKSNMTPLMVAAGMGRNADRTDVEATHEQAFEAAKLAYELSDKEINAVDSSNGRTALAEAGNNGEDLIIQYLVDHGADPNIRDKKGETAWSLAVALNNVGDVNHVATGELLVKLGAKKLTAADFPAGAQAGKGAPPPAAKPAVGSSPEVAKPTPVVQGAAD